MTTPASAMFFFFIMLFVHVGHSSLPNPIPWTTNRLPRDAKVYDVDALAGRLSEKIAGFGPQSSVWALNTICSQEPDDEGMVSAAFSLTGVMAWNEYMNRIGREQGDPRFLWAAPGWNTFRGSCGLLAAQSWAENDDLVLGELQENLSPRYSLDVDLKLEGKIPPFRCKTQLPWWAAQLHDINTFRLNFTAQMRGLPDEIWGQWKGYFVDEGNNNIGYTERFTIPACSVAGLGVAIVQRHVVAYPVFHVQEYNMFRAGTARSYPTWRGMGGNWGSVYAAWRTVECQAATAQWPNAPVAHVQPLNVPLPPRKCIQ
jgi:hypothetical protein